MDPYESIRILLTNWIIPIISILAFVISITTLYLAHLRGPNIQHATINSRFVQRGFSRNDKYYTIDVKIIIVNIGIRAGILYGVEILGPKKDLVIQVKQDLLSILPKPLNPGEYLEVNYQALIPQFKMDEMCKSKQIKVQYIIESTTSIFGVIKNRTNVIVDIESLCNAYKK